MIQKSALIKGLLIGTACIATIAYLRPSDSIPNSGREVDIADGFSPLSSVTQQPKSTRPPTDTAIASDDKGGDWFVIENHSGKCKPDEAPSGVPSGTPAVLPPLPPQPDNASNINPKMILFTISS